MLQDRAHAGHDPQGILGPRIRHRLRQGLIRRQWLERLLLLIVVLFAITELMEMYVTERGGVAEFRKFWRFREASPGVKLLSEGCI